MVIKGGWKMPIYEINLSPSNCNLSLKNPPKVLEICLSEVVRTIFQTNFSLWWALFQPVKFTSSHPLATALHIIVILYHLVKINLLITGVLILVFIGAIIQISWAKVQCGLCVKGDGRSWKEKHTEDSGLTSGPYRTHVFRLGRYY